MKVLIADKFEQHGVDALKALGCEVASMPDLDAASLPVSVRELDPSVLVVRSTRVSQQVFDSASSLKLVVRAGAGFDTIDTAGAASAGVGVCNCPGMNAAAVAELVMGLMLACDRGIPDQVIDFRAGHWRKKHYSTASGLAGRTLGIVGVGSIGREVIKRCAAFDMRVIAHSLNMTRLRAGDLGVESGGSTRDELYEMLSRSDVVSIHVNANPQSDGLCDDRFFEAMRDGAIFINTSRGSVFDPGALARAIKAKGIRAGLDVYRNEPAGGESDWSDPLMELPGVYGTHHVGASTDQAQLAVADEVVRIVDAWKTDGRFKNRVN